MNINVIISIYQDHDSEYALKELVKNAQYDVYEYSKLFEIYQDSVSLRELNKARVEYLDLLESNGLPVPKSMLEFL